ncbi:MAG: hypothetical protein ACYDHW_17190, partial [Syntrophorhabdaceae bacterium]
GTSLPNPLENGRGHGIVAGQQFIEKLKTQLAIKDRHREMPQTRRITQKIRPEIIIGIVSSLYEKTEQEILRNRGEARQMLMDMLYRYGGMNNREIGELLDLDYSTVSVTRKRLSEKITKNKECRQRIQDLEKRLLSQE